MFIRVVDIEPHAKKATPSPDPVRWMTGDLWRGTERSDAVVDNGDA